MLQRYYQLSNTERRDLWAALPRLAIVRLSLLTGVGNTRQWFQGRKQVSCEQASMEKVARWKQRALALKRASRIVPDSHCLARSLALRWWMRNHGLAAEAVIGVRRDQARAESHAWVMLGQDPIDEAPDILARYVIIFPKSAAEKRC